MDLCVCESEEDEYSGPIKINFSIKKNKKKFLKSRGETTGDLVGI